jgi:nitrogen fixation protein NifU and related proteins
MNNYYTKETMERFLKPNHMGKIEDADGVGKVGSPRCGDMMEVFLKINSGIIEDASFQTYGCVAAIATSDVVCEMAIGKTIEEAKKINEKEMITRLEKLPSVKIHCSSLAIEGLKEAIKDYEGKK